MQHTQMAEAEKEREEVEISADECSYRQTFQGYYTNYNAYF